MLRILAQSLLCLSLLVGCANPLTSPSQGPPSSSPSPEASARTSPGRSGEPTPVPVAPEPSVPPTTSPPASPSLQAALPVLGSANETGESVQMTLGPAGGLYVLIPAKRGSVVVVALLDSTGKPRPGWPIALDDTACELPAPAPDGSIRVVCSIFDPVSRAYGFTPDGRSIAGWPVELPRSESFTAPRVVGGDLYVLTSDPNDNVGLRLVAVAPDGTTRTGTRYERPAPCCQDSRAQLGPGGTGYLLAFPNEPPDEATGDTEITAFDLGGVRKGWLARVKGWSSDLVFGPDGRIYVTEGQEGRRPSRILVFDHDGRALPIGSDALPVEATSVYQGAGPLGGPPPPVVAEDGTTFLVSEEGGTTVYGLDASGDVIAGWPYRDTVGLQWSPFPPLGDTGGSRRRFDPAVGPGDVLYLLHPPRAATLGGTIVAIRPDGRVRPGWPVVLKRPGAQFRAVVVGSDGTAYALAIEPETGDASSASILAIAPDSTVLYTTTIIEP